MPSDDNRSQPGYPIGVVSRLTNIHPETLRVWERRYGLVHPQRNARRGRLYSDDDVQRLSLVKQLVDAGHPVSLVAPLSLEGLQARLKTVPALPGRATSGRDGTCRVAVVGESLGVRLRQNRAGYSDLDLLGVWRDPGALAAQAASRAPDVLLIEQPTLQPDSVARIDKLLSDCGAKGAVVLFGFGARATLRDLEHAGVRCLQAPVTDSEIRRACLAAAVQNPRGTAQTQPPPGRRFTPEQLARIATKVPSIACECPHHLVDLIAGVAAFEAYSSQCLHRNAKDARIHAFLQSTAASALALLEQGLARVIEHEGIQV